MAADLSIHIFEGIEESDLAKFFSNTLGSKYFAPVTVAEHDSSIYSKIADTPSVWVGEVSWLKADLLGDSDTFIPNAVGAVYDIIGEDLPVIDDELIEKIREALGLENNTVKEGGVWNGNGYDVSDSEIIIRFLEEHKGKKAFTVSW